MISICVNSFQWDIISYSFPINTVGELYIKLKLQKNKIKKNHYMEKNWNDCTFIKTENIDDKLIRDQSCSTFDILIMMWDFIGVKLIGAGQLATEHLHTSKKVQRN